MATWLALGVYAVVVLSLGRLGEGSVERRGEFWTAGRQLGGIGAGISLSAGFMSISWSCVYAIQMFYWYGLSALWLMTVPWMLALAGIYWLARRFRDLPAFSQPEMVRRRFGRGAAGVVALVLAVVFLIWGGAEVAVAGKLLAPDLGIDPRWVMVIIAVVIGVYSTMGGFAAVVRTDRVQFVVVALYLLFVGAVALRRAAGASVPAQPARADGLWFDPGLLPLIGITALAYLPGWLSEADLWLRVQAARNEREARIGAGIGLVNAFLFVGVVPAIIGISALRLFPPADPASAALVGGEGETIVAALVAPLADQGWVTTLLALGLVTAAMSTIDTCANVVSLSVGRDLLGLEETGRSRVANGVAVAATLGVALRIESLWDVFYLSSGLLSTAVAVPVLATVVAGVGRRAVLCSSVSGLVATTLGYWAQATDRVPLVGAEATGLEYLLFGIVAAAAGLAVGTWADRRSGGGDRIDL